MKKQTAKQKGQRIATIRWLCGERFVWAQTQTGYVAVRSDGITFTVGSKQTKVESCRKDTLVELPLYLDRAKGEPPLYWFMNQIELIQHWNSDAKTISRKSY